MGLFARPAPTPDELAAYVPLPPRLRVLRADGQRIDLTSRNAGQALVAARQGWQSDGFAYRDMIGELRYAVRLLARSVAKVRFYVAETRPHPADPAPLDTPEGEDPEHGLDAQLAADAVHNFGRLPLDTNPDGFVARLVENLSIAGEGWVHLDAEERFHVRSVSEVTASADGRVTLNGLPTAIQGTTRAINPDTESLMRCWVAHPEWAQLADSPMRSLLHVAEDVVLAGREQRSAARSRLAANGILFISDAMSLVRTRAEDDDRDDAVTSDTFMADFVAAVTAPIADDGDAGGVAPIVIRGAIEDIAAVKHVTFDRADSKELIGRQSAAILRLLKGLDIQPEQVEGLSNSNHWNAWAIDARSIRDQVAPMAETVAACLAQAYLRPVLEALGHTPQDAARVTIAVDVSPLAENPNRGQDARDAHAALAISDDAFREALGFDVDDAPDEAEVIRRLASTGRLPAELTAAILGVRTQDPPRTVDGEAVPVRELPAPQPRPAASPGQVNPTRPTPVEPDLSRGPAGQVVAAAPPQEWRVVVATELADIDTALLDRITVAADAAVARVVEKAGARVRTAARRDHAVTASVAGMDAHLIASHLGRGTVEAFVSVRDLIVDAYGRLQAQVGKWLSAAADQAADAVLRILRLRKATPRGRQVHDTVTARLRDRSGAVWPALARALDIAAERALFTPDPLTPDPERAGEHADTLIRPGEVRAALDAAGGDGASAGGGGFAGGPTVRRVLGEQGGVVLGYEWLYRPEILRPRPFLPHAALDGLRFGTFTDPKLDTGPTTAWLGPYFAPGDHDGCLCTSAPIIAFPELDDGVIARRLREAAGDPRNILAAEVAAQDDREGRIGTSLQNEVEVRTRITDAVERLTADHVTNPR